MILHRHAEDARSRPGTVLTATRCPVVARVRGDQIATLTACRYAVGFDCLLQRRRRAAQAVRRWPANRDGAEERGVVGGDLRIKVVPLGTRRRVRRERSAPEAIDVNAADLIRLYVLERYRQNVDRAPIRDAGRAGAHREPQHR